MAATSSVTATTPISRREFIRAGSAATLLPMMVRGREGGSPGASFVDTHVHLARGLHRGQRLRDAVDTAQRAMAQFGIERAVVSPPPFPPGHRGMYGLDEIAAAVRGNGRFAFVAGGESLNPLLQSTPADAVTPDVVKHFTDAAERIVASGAAGFGELAVEHFSSGVGGHPYESVFADHPLLLALADVAATHSLPIDLHMEAVPQDMPFPPNRARGENPATLSANIPRFERLLDHNPSARIVWLHAGWDLTGERTVPLMQQLLEKHPNLSMSIKLDRTGAQKNSPLAQNGDEIRPAWLAMLRALPTRFVIGSDQFIDQGTDRFEYARHFVDGLPSDLQSIVTSANAGRIYRLPG